MQFTVAASLFLAALSLADGRPDDDIRGIIYTGEDREGIAFKIRTPNCIRLRKPLLNNISSIDVTLFQECTLYYERECDDNVAHVALYNDEKTLSNTAVKAVRCVDVDA